MKSRRTSGRLLSTAARTVSTVGLLAACGSAGSSVNVGASGGSPTTPASVQPTPTGGPPTTQALNNGTAPAPTVVSGHADNGYGVDPAVWAKEQTLLVCVQKVSSNCGLAGRITVDGVLMPDYDIASKLLSFWQVGRFNHVQASPDVLYMLDPQDISLYRPALATTSLNELLLAGAQKDGKMASDAEVRNSGMNATTPNAYTAAQDHLTIEDQKNQVVAASGETTAAHGPQQDAAVEHSRTTALRNWLTQTLPSHNITITGVAITTSDLPADLPDGL